MVAVGQQTFGIDHPLITVKDHAQALEQFTRLGFAPSPVSYHPWGTLTSLLNFPGNFVEVISVNDESKFGTNAVNGFCFGRQVGQFLQRGEEGISLLALHSKDADADHAELVSAGLASQGRIDFRRKMKLPDGTPDEAIVSLALFMDDSHPDISNFICHQHRPELIWVKGWQQHPNGAVGIAKVTYTGNPDIFEERWKAIYGDRVVRHGSVVEADTGCGILQAMSPEQACEHFMPLSLPAEKQSRPHAIALTIKTSTPEKLREILQQNNVPFHEFDGRILIAPALAGNTILEFIFPC